VEGLVGEGEDGYSLPCAEAKKMTGLSGLLYRTAIRPKCFDV